MFLTRHLNNILRTLCLGIALMSVGSSVQATDAARPDTTLHQLRIYEIFDGNKKLFHDRFRDHAMRIMARYDFKIVSMWETRRGERTEFVYLLEWPDKQTMNDRWGKFKADQEWADIKRATNQAGSPLLGEMEDRTLELTDYSPQRKLIR
ncbi:NIPSNAP family protein [Undibacterium sp. TS12]|uniref:NIPSNAP family protein n=1 Tax=Undibacterium sp. TS12 TaxID=2908202 RepID=UPI001F4CC08D|nr:NIPSNAP family protein [Undibacterium sp. TS12]MCH8617890.1 NIPSNAP family protein [Undibacterium sp. TS12]